MSFGGKHAPFRKAADRRNRPGGLRSGTSAGWRGVRAAAFRHPPPAGAGAKSTYQVENLESLRETLAEIQPTPARPTLAEEFIRGTEHSFDAVMIGGKLVWHSLTHYLPTPLDVLRNPWIQWCILLPREIDHPRYDDIKVAATAALPFVQPALWDSYVAHPFGSVLPLIAACVLLTAWYGRRSQRYGVVFVCWSLFIVVGLASFAWGMFPNLLIATGDPTYSLTIFNSAASSYGLWISLVWFSIGISLVVAYTTWVYASFRGKVERLPLEEPY